MITILPNDVRHFMDEYLARFRQQSTVHIDGCYLYGSIALGAYDPAKSDLDFMVVLSSPLAEADLLWLKHFHTDLCLDLPLARKLEGHYVPLDDIQRCDFAHQYPSVANGRYQGIHGVMTLYWYQLHTIGVRILGPTPKELFSPIPWEQVLDEMDSNINGYWYNRTQQPEETFFSDSAIDFAVLTICRILYTLERRQIISKTDAGRWAMQQLPVTWHRLIDEAVRIRLEKDATSLYTSPPQRAHETRQFILDLREQCNHRYFSR